jgi:predicted TIM-barrel fold metal-dependent hydrolase
MRTIALEEHCLTPELKELLGEQIHPYYAVHRWPPALEARLMDVGEGRITEMDAHGIDVQVLSMVQPGLEHSSPHQAVPVARAFNDRVAEAIAAHPDPFAGFAALPTADPNAAAKELTRAVDELGFKGALINGRTQERFLDDEFFWPMFESAEGSGCRSTCTRCRRRRRSMTRTTRALATTSGSCSRRRPGAGTSRPGCTPCV